MRGMASFRFVTEWRLRAPIEKVFETIADTDSWPSWWPMVRKVERQLDGDANGVGQVNRFTFVGKLPYRLAFDMRVTRHEAPTALSGSATGELEGMGDWTLREDGEWTVARYVWAIRTTRPWMNAFAPLPFVKEIFAFNHHAVMRNGLAGIRRHLGGIEGTYSRLD
jgi:uncharacterized protein YndB with AHSA1/START domain